MPRFVGALGRPFQSARIYKWVSSPRACLGLCRSSCTGRTWRAELWVVRKGLTALQAGLWAAVSVCYTCTELTPKESLERTLLVLSRFPISTIPFQRNEWHTMACGIVLPSLLLWLLVFPNLRNGPKDCRALTLFTGVSQNFVDLCICRVLPQCPDDITNLAEGDLGITSPVKEEEGLLEVCKRKATLSQAAPSWQRCEPVVSWHCSTDSRGIWPTVPRKTPPLWHFSFTIFKLLYLPFTSFLALIAINSFVIDPAVISRTGKDKFVTNTVVQEQVSSHDGAADGKNVVIHCTLSLQRTGTVKCLAVQTLCLFSGFCLQSQHLNNTANRKLEGGFQMLLLLFSLKIALHWGFWTCLFPLFFLFFVVCPCFLQMHEYSTFPVEVLNVLLFSVHFQYVHFETSLLPVLPSDQCSLLSPCWTRPSHSGISRTKISTDSCLHCIASLYLMLWSSTSIILLCFFAF